MAAARVLYEEQHPGEGHHPPGGDGDTKKLFLCTTYVFEISTNERGAGGGGVEISTDEWGKGAALHLPPDQGLKGDPKRGSPPPEYPLLQGRTSSFPHASYLRRGLLPVRTLKAGWRAEWAGPERGR